MRRSLARSIDTVPDVVPILSPGRHRSPRSGACFMEFASFLAGERWSDHPACTHPVLAALARDVNDLISDDARRRLVPLIGRVVGLNSPDPHLSIAIAARAAVAAIPIASLERQRALGAGLLSLLSTHGTAELQSRADAAFEAAPDARTWGRRYLATLHAHGTLAARTIAMVHTSVAGIAAACVDDADDRLVALLRDVIEETERSLGRAGVAPAASTAERRSVAV